jgi:hypothetical protein
MRFVRVIVTQAVATAVLLAALAFAGPASAVIGGTDDLGNRYESVGVLQLDADGEWFDFCSGTLVADNVVLTAAHCVDFFTADVGEEGLGPDDLRVSFDPAPDETSTYYSVEEIVIHPDWASRPQGRGNSKRLYLAPPAEDIALVFLTEDVAGVDPSPVADADYFDGIDITAETFTVVGYGTDEYITGSAMSAKAVTVFDGIRSYRDVSVITLHDAFPDRFLKITAGVCFGDSGGPLFHEDTVVALNSWTFSMRCAGPNLEYRLDSPTAQTFLDANL